MKYIFFFLIISTYCFSQTFSFIYETKYKLNTENPDDINKDNMILDFNGSSSIFRELQNKKTDSLKLNNSNGMVKMGIENQFYVKKDLAQNKIEKIVTYLGTDYLLPIDEKLNWKIISEQKTIGKYKTQKSETNYGGRNWIALFTTDLPFSDGPYVFSGLPGLIISIHDTNNDYSFNLIQVKKGGNIFDARTKTIKIDWKKFETLAKSYYNDPYDLNSKVGRKVTMTDPSGNKLDIAEMSKNSQNDIIQQSNPLELNHKVKYK
ncbi:GLPGLI family protein [Chryseobacterium sp. 52]|uniref:GLPGLI family protein n=1 Tax=Chryseobacterium sp. 52 TaxID=2035213 RepID=UPI000C1769C0|nr:GLPGLI family protein [Chryseobacterium sp. 52]PIF46382.1 GLPGLI family protein [Chryseobacterium sp. 52]